MRFLLILLIFTPLQIMAASILIIESYHQEYQWDKDYNKGLISILGDEHTYQNFYMETKRLPKEEFLAQADLAWEAYNTMKPDLVVLADENAVKFLHLRFQGTDTPIVLLGLNANPRSYNINHKKNFTGVLERPIFKRSLIFAHQILPKKPKRRFLVLFDNSKTSITAMEQISPSLESLTIGNITSDFLLTNNFNIWKKAIITAEENGYDAIFIGLYHTINNSSDKHSPPDNVINWTKKMHHYLTLAFGNLLSVEIKILVVMF